jgi:adenylate cyclase
MALEIERKFLVVNASWKLGATATRIVQGYISRDPDRIVRVRIAGEKAYLTIKGRPTGITRTEIEFPIPLAEADALLPLCLPPLIDKTRYTVTIGSHLWEIDEFYGENAGLIVAEIELSQENEAFQLPTWLGREVSHNRNYSNSHLTQHPYTAWPDEEKF